LPGGKLEAPHAWQLGLTMHRRDFVKAVAGGSLAGPAANLLLSACAARSAQLAGSEGAPFTPLYVPPAVSPENLTLTARRVTVEIARGVSSPVLTWGDGPVSPTIEARTGQRATIVMRNALNEPTIAHWHGLRPPESSDGHPRLQVGGGGQHAYDFVVREPAGLYWYHSHAHARTAPQVYLGLAGLFIVRDDAEEALGLPSGTRELALVLQDKRQGPDGELVYEPVGHELMEGLLSDRPFVNGVHFPRIEVDASRYRLRVLAAANARIFRLGLSSGAPLTLIGADAGLLEAPVELPWIDLGTGERADLLVDFSGLPPGATVRLRSLGFANPGGMGMGRGMMGRGRMMMGGGAQLPQGAELDLAEFVVTRGGRRPEPMPSRLGRIDRLAPAGAERERVFRFDSRMMMHTINGRTFEMERVDERVRFGATEIWRFINDGPFPHPVHMHAVHFQVLSRTGGRARVLPWERGWKDTVLLFPGEAVDVIARFDSHRGLFLLHCHNLEHEDLGMMLNFRIE
jgi:FtsP/CotA-like multicopper oxidase with cupredoxin domain